MSTELGEAWEKPLTLVYEFLIYKFKQQTQLYYSVKVNKKIRTIQHYLKKKMLKILEKRTQKTYLKIMYKN